MIKTIIQKIMVKQFSKYIKGIEYNKLTLEVFGGLFSIQNIALNHDYFNALELPVLVAFSHIGKLSIEAPLTKLSSVPVSCTIENVYIILSLKKGAHQLNQVNKQELLQKYIRDTFELLTAKTKDANKQEGMLDKLGKKIIDNLKFHVKNIHIRFQNSNAAHTYSFGVSLKSLTFGTTDKSLNPIFMEREKGKEQQSIFKALSIQNFKIYWQSIGSKSADQHLFLRKSTDADKIEAMRKYLSNESDAFLTINSLLKIAINPSTKWKMPLFEVAVNLEPISIQFSKQKTVELLDFITSCVKHNELMLKALLEKAAKKPTNNQVLKMKPLCEHYTRLYLQRETAKTSKSKNSRVDDTDDFSYLFDNCSLEDLYQWSLQPIKDKVHLLRQKELKKQRKGWFSSTEVELSPEEVKELQRLINELTEDSIGGKGRPTDSILFKLIIDLEKVSFCFYDQTPQNQLRTIKLSIEGISSMTQKSHDKVWFATENKVKKIIIDMGLDRNGKEEHIHLMQNLKSSQTPYLLEVGYRQTVKLGKNTQVESNIEFNLGKTLFTYKVQYWKMFKSFFWLPEINQQVQNEAFGKFQQLRAENSEEEQFNSQRLQNIRVSLMSPCFVVPLSDTTCWYLDLGTIQMKSEPSKGQRVYPFKLRHLSMRYIDNKQAVASSQLIVKSQTYFPIIKDVNLDLKVSVSDRDSAIDLDLSLDRVDISASNQQFAELLKLQKALLGEQQAQVQQLQQLQHTKKDLLSKARVSGPLKKRGKYLNNWAEYFGVLSGNAIYFYKSEKQLSPDLMLQLRGAQVSRSRKDNLEEQLQILVGSDTTYLQFSEFSTLQKWQAQLSEAINCLKHIDQLILEGQKKAGSRADQTRKQTKRVTLRLRELCCNYLQSSGQSLMRLRLLNVNWQLFETHVQMQTVCEVGSLTIHDQLYPYKDPSFQHLLITQNLCLSVETDHSKQASVRPLAISTKLDSIDCNWKPDVLLMVIQNLNAFLDVKPIQPNRHLSTAQRVHNVRTDPNLNNKAKRYAQEGADVFVKAKRTDYLKLRVKEQEVYLSVKGKVSEVKMRFFHRQSHMPMFMIGSQQLSVSATLAGCQMLLKGHLKTFDIFEIFGYPQPEYEINKEYKPFSLLEKQPQARDSKALQFEYSSFEAESIANCQRVDKFLKLQFCPLKMHYFQQITMRLIDYVLIQVLLLLAKPQMLTANEDVLQQLLEQRQHVDKPRVFMDDQFEAMIQKFIDPYFMDYSIVFQRPEIILAKTKQTDQHLALQAQEIVLSNKTLKSQRFDKVDWELKSMVYEEEILMRGDHLKLVSVSKGCRRELTPQAFQCKVVVNRLLLEDQLTAINSGISGYDRSIKIDNQMSAVRIPELSRVVYQMLLGLPNFNLSFQDGAEELFIHNYRITKTLSPKPIEYTMSISQLGLVAQHSIDKENTLKSKLFQVAVDALRLQYLRDAKLNAIIEIELDSAQAYLFEHHDLSALTAPERKPFVRISNPKKQHHCYFIIKMPNTGKLDIQAFLQECQLFLHPGILPLVAQWVQPEEQVFPTASQTTKPIFFTFRMLSLLINFQDENSSSSLKSLGQMVVEVTRPAGESQYQLRKGFRNGTIKADFIEALRPFMSINVILSFQFFCRFKGRDRKLLDKTTIELRESSFYKIRNRTEFKKTVHRKFTMSELRGSISVDDILLFACLEETIKKANSYQFRYKQLLQSSFSNDAPDNIYKDVFKEQKLLEEVTMKVEGFKIYLISKEGLEYIPILKLFSGKLELSKFMNGSNSVVSGNVRAGVNYFNDHIFRWEPLVEPFELRMNLMTNDRLQQVVEIDALNDVMINFSRESALSIKKCIKTIEDKLQLVKQDKYQPEVAQQFVSRYIIKNWTGYPIEVFNEAKVSMYVIMNGDEVSYTSKTLISCFFEENQLRQTIAFNVLHPSQEFMAISGISLESTKSFDIDLYSSKGHKLNEKCSLFLDNQVKGCKKILTLRSKKYITDFTLNQKQISYYPFDHPDEVTLDDQQHKGFKANFYKESRSERFLYEGSFGHIVIRKQYLVYNYTVIPLKVSNFIVVPGQFVGVNGNLTIQGLPLDESYLKVVFNKHKQQYYIYSLCYLIDYVGLHLTFDSKHPIKQLYSHQLKEGNQPATIYLLPDINTNFSVSRSPSSKAKTLKGKLAKEQFELTQGNQTHLYSCSSSLQTFCQQHIKDFRKVIQITHAFILCNDTHDVITIKQRQAKAKPHQLPPQTTKEFSWPESSLEELIQVSLLTEQEEWQSSSPLSIKEDTMTFIVRSKTHEANYRILSLELEETDNVTFVHIADGSAKIQVLNCIPYSSITMHQTVIFENRNVNLQDPQNYTQTVGYTQRKSFGYQLPKHDHSVSVHIELSKDHYNCRDLSFAINDLESNLIEKTFKINEKDPHSQELVISLHFDNGSKTIEFSLNKRDTKEQAFSTVATCRVKALTVSLIGLHDSVRKEIVVCCLAEAALNLYLNAKTVQAQFETKSIRVENTLKADPYFIALFRQAQKKELPAFTFLVKRSRTNSRLIFYVGCSLRTSVLTVTSEELQVLEQNINSIKELMDQKSDTNCLLRVEDKFRPSKGRREKMYFGEAQLHPVRLIITYKHVNNWGGKLLNALSLNECKIKLDGKQIKDFFCTSLLDFALKIGSHFKAGLSNELFSMIGSLALLGSPLNLASKIGGGITKLISLPADGFQGEGVLGAGKGLALGTGSFISNTIEGAFGSVQSITGTIGNGLSGLASYDKSFEKKRQALKNERVEHVGDGLVSGGKSIVNGLFAGFTGLVKEPFRGAEKEGLGGFFKGGLKGITGLVVKPVSGVVDATAKTAEGIKNTTKVFSKEARELRTRQYYLRPFYGSCRQIRTYNKQMAMLNTQLSGQQQCFESLSWAGTFELRGDQLLLVTYEYLLFLNRYDLAVNSYLPSCQVVSLTREQDRILIVARDEEGKTQKRRVEAKLKEECWGQLRQIHSYYHKRYETGLTGFCLPTAK